MDLTVRLFDGDKLVKEVKIAYKEMGNAGIIKYRNEYYRFFHMPTEPPTTLRFNKVEVYELKD